MPDWVEQYEGEPYEKSMARLVAMHRIIAKQLAEEGNKGQWLRTAVLFLSVFTAGVLWMRITQSAPEEATWIGAIIGTTIMFLLLYDYQLGPAKKVSELADLHTNFSWQLARAREHKERLSWHDFKGLENPYVRLGLPLPTKKQIEDAGTTGML